MPVEASLYDAIHTSVAEDTGAPLEEVERELAHREACGDELWDAYERAVSDATRLFCRVTGRPLPERT